MRYPLRHRATPQGVPVGGASLHYNVVARNKDSALQRTYTPDYIVRAKWIGYQALLGFEPRIGLYCEGERIGYQALLGFEPRIKFYDDIVRAKG